MGADIHVYIEYEAFTQQDGTPWWSPFGGHINLNRQYSLFGRIANVRQEGALFEPRGLPDGLAYEAEGDCRRRVLEDDDEQVDSEGCVSRTVANRWVGHGEKITTIDGRDYVSHPDWHSHTWFSPSEWRQILQAQEEAAFKLPDECSPPGSDYYAVAAALEALEGDDRQVRVVCWFDN